MICLRRRGALALAALAATSAPLGAQDPPRILRGQVTDSAYTPIALAEITLLGTDLRAYSDTIGLFRIVAVPRGVHPVVVRAIGWKPLFFMIRMEDDQEQIVRVGLERVVQRLPDLTVEAGRFAKPAEYAFTTKYDDYFRRRRTASGVFRDKNDVLFRSAFDTADLLRAIPGVQVVSAQGTTNVVFQACAEAYAKVSVWIDGAQVATADHNEALRYIRPNEIEFIEIYRRSGQIPGEFLGDSCAAIVIWTR